MDAKTIGIVLSIFVPALRFIVWAYPDAKLSRILATSFGPSPIHLEARSNFLMRQAAFAAVWLMFLAAVGGLIYVSVREGYMVFHSETAFVVVSFMLSIGLGIAVIALIGAVVWALTLRFFRRDWTYNLENELAEKKIKQIVSGNLE